ncbi:MAG: hypothetical protein A2076_08775 [Geobacteraceae bacterium GWC2_53_11]|nr:MAG: hypothetical protein A2076_08775 [Geobacteraceae bacterium GWC2_53_11]
MKKLRYGLFVLMILLCPVTYAKAQVSIGIGLPNLSIGINLPVFPELAPVPGYPVYYAPQVNGNYFFYDGMYWVYQDDNWYASSWYNGPWGFVEPYAVPLYVLRIPVRYYRQPPVYFRGWQSNAPPRWGQHWGHEWQQRRGGWDRWNRSAVPARAPRPTYQRQYSGDRYPRQIEQQHTVRSQSYHYQPRDKAVRQHLQQQRNPPSAQRGRPEVQPGASPRQIAPQHPAPRQQGAPADMRSQPPQRGGDNAHRITPGQPAPQQRGPEVRGQGPQREQQAPRVQGQEHKQQDRGEAPDSGRDRGQGRDKDDDRGRGR